MASSDDWLVLHFLREEVETIRNALSGAERALPDSPLRRDCAQALGMVAFAEQRAEAEAESDPRFPGQLPPSWPAAIDDDVADR
jgi:hypothetical protein